MTGKDKFDEARKKIKDEVEEKEVQEEKAIEKVKSDLASVKDDPELAKMYQESAGIGLENSSGSQLPYLRVHSENSKTNFLPDETKPNNGWFFYKPSQEQFKEVECHILYISETYYTVPVTPRADGKNNFNQIIAGVLIREEKYLPFVFILQGQRPKILWEYLKNIHKFTHAKPVPTPIFVLKTKMTTERIPTNNKLNPYTYITNFELVKSENGSPVVVSDVKLFNILKAGSVNVKEKINRLIKSIAILEQEEEVKPLGEDQEEKYVNGIGEEMPF